MDPLRPCEVHCLDCNTHTFTHTDICRIFPILLCRDSKGPRWESRASSRRRGYSHTIGNSGGQDRSGLIRSGHHGPPLLPPLPPGHGHCVPGAGDAAELPGQGGQVGGTQVCRGAVNRLLVTFAPFVTLAHTPCCGAADTVGTDQACLWRPNLPSLHIPHATLQRPQPQPEAEDPRDPTCSAPGENIRPTPVDDKDT